MEKKKWLQERNALYEQRLAFEQRVAAYVVENWKKVKSFSSLQLLLEEAWYGPAPVSENDFLAKERNLYYRGPIESLEVVFDPSDGDVSLNITTADTPANVRLEHNFVGEVVVIQLADYIAQELGGIPAGIPIRKAPNQYVLVPKDEEVYFEQNDQLVPEAWYASQYPMGPGGFGGRVFVPAELYVQVISNAKMYLAPDPE